MKTFLVRLWSYRVLRFLCWSVICLATLLTLFWAIMDWKAQRQWQAALARIQREGETLDFYSLLPTPLEEAENFAAIPSLRGITLVLDGDPEKGIPAQKRQALEELGSGLTSRPFKGVASGQVPDWPTIAASLVKNRLLDALPPPGHEAAAIQKAMEIKRPLLMALSQPASRYQQAEFTPNGWDKERPPLRMALAFPHYNCARSASLALMVHGIAAAEAGDKVAALADLHAMLLLADAAHREPMAISYVMALIHDTQTLELAWHLLQQRSLDEADLTTVQDRLTRINAERFFLQATRTELGAGLEMMDYMASQPHHLGDPNSKFMSASIHMPRWFVASNKASLVEMNLDVIIQPLKTGGLPVALRQLALKKKSVPAGNWRFLQLDSLFANMALPSIMTIMDGAVPIEASVRQSVIACALERYYLQHHRYPAKLAELQPDYLTAIPVDPVNGQPMGYGLTAEGRYKLWSVGMDEKDDQKWVAADVQGRGATGLSEDSDDCIWQYVPGQPSPKSTFRGTRRARVPLGN